MAKSALESLMTPGDVAGGIMNVQPATPGMWSDEDESRAQLTQGAMMDRAADLGGLVMGGAYAAAPAMKNASGMGIKAYHGSPHDFDRFDLSKIGTGEGAQAYGHGLYFADKEGVAKAYRDALAGGSDRFVGGQPYNSKNPEHLAASLSKTYANYGGRDRILQLLQDDLANINLNDASRDTYRQTIKLIKDGAPLADFTTAPRGRMYEVDINAHPDQFLDFDKPLAAQPKAVQDIFPQISKPHDYTVRPSASGKTWSVLHPGGWVPNGAQNFYKSESAAAAAADMMNQKRTIQDLVPRDMDQMGAMREAGIPGIKYLDQGSRAAGDGSRNYVVFDDKLINILRKYGLPMTAGPLAALMAMGNEPAQAAP